MVCVISAHIHLFIRSDIFGWKLIIKCIMSWFKWTCMYIALFQFNGHSKHFTVLATLTQLHTHTDGRGISNSGFSILTLSTYSSAQPSLGEASNQRPFVHQTPRSTPELQPPSVNSNTLKNESKIDPACRGSKCAGFGHFSFTFTDDGLIWWIEQIAATGLKYHCWPCLVSIHEMVQPHPAPIAWSHTSHQILFESDCIHCMELNCLGKVLDFLMDICANSWKSSLQCWRSFNS